MEKLNIYQIDFSNNAIRDIKQIAYYIKFKLFNSQASNRFVQNILLKIELLQYFPYMGPIYHHDEYRYIVYKNFLILYFIEEKTVYIEKVINRLANK